MNSQNSSFSTCRGAVVGVLAWYLMVPPIGNIHAPTFLWNSYDTFDSVQECLRVRDLEVQWAMAWTKKPDSPSSYQYIAGERSVFDGLSASCVTSDELLPKDRSRR
jgi:hypothetical protein